MHAVQGIPYLFLFTFSVSLKLLIKLCDNSPDFDLLLAPHQTVLSVAKCSEGRTYELLRNSARDIMVDIETSLKIASGQPRWQSTISA